MVDQRLEELGWTPTDLGRKLGYKHAYQGYYTLFVSERTQLTISKLQQIAEVLELPRNHFVEPDTTAARLEYVRNVLAEFATTEIGRAIDDDTRRTLASVRFLGDQLPTVRTYQALALALVGTSTRPAAEVLPPRETPEVE